MEKNRILIVDDDQVLCFLLEELLLHNGYIPSCAFSGKDALKIFGENSFHLILTDLNMPYIDGFELIKRIKEIRTGIPVILMTGDSDPAIENKARNLGASGFIRKPLNPDNILIIIEEVLKNKNKQKNDG